MWQWLLLHTNTSVNAQYQRWSSFIWWGGIALLLASLCLGVPRKALAATGPFDLMVTDARPDQGDAALESLPSAPASPVGDSDDDGVSDEVEDRNNDGDPFNDDLDGDGLPDFLDIDDDGDGIPTRTEHRSGSVRAAGNGLANELDLDSDDDGILDVIEAGGLIDANGDGLADGSDANLDGVIDTPQNSPLDTDGDGTLDYLSLDSNSDGVFDLVQNGGGPFDSDQDGRVDGPDSDGDGICDLVDGNPARYGDAPSTPLPLATLYLPMIASQ